MNDTWVKLYRKSLSNDVRRHDPTAWRLFETLLLLVDHKTGIWSGGIYQLTEADGNLNSNTIYKALIRLEEKGMIVKRSNTRYSEISICKYSQYSKDGNTSRRNTGETQAKPSKTLTRSKEERIKNIDTNVSMAKTPSTEIDELFNLWEEITGMEIVGQVRKNRFACSNLLKKHGKEKLTKLINGVALAQADKFAPRIADFSALQSKQNELIAWGKTNQSSAMKKVAVI